MGGTSEHNFEFIVENKDLLERLVQLCDHESYMIRKEAMVTIYNLCENHNSKYLSKVIAKDPTIPFYKVLQNYDKCDPYLIKIALSYCCLICEKYRETAVSNII